MKTFIPPLTVSRAVTPEGMVFVFLSGCGNYVYRRDADDTEGWTPIPFACYKPEQLPPGTEIKAAAL